MAAEIFNKADGTVRAVELDSIQLGDASVVRLQLSCDQVQSMQRAGNDLVISLRDGKQIRIGNFFKAGEADSIHDVVLQDSSGNVWLADPDDATNFCKVAEWGDLFETVGGGEGMGGALLPLLGAGAGIGIIAAAAGGGGGSDGPPRDTIRPEAPTASLIVDSAIPDDKITNQGGVRVSNIEAGAKVEYQIGNGNWVVITGDTFTLPPGDYPVVNVRQTDAAGNVSPIVNIGPIIVDITAAPPTAELAVDTGSDTSDQVTKNGQVNVAGTEPGALVEYRVNGGSWTPVVNGSFTLLEDGIYTDVSVRQTDVAGNVSDVANIGRIVVDNDPPTDLEAELLGAEQASENDGLTNNAAVQVSGIEADSTVQYSIDGGVDWVNAELGEDGTFDLPDGDYEAVLVREVDLAGNEGVPVNLGSIEIDTEQPDELGAELEEDTGSSASDGITTNGTVLVDEPEEGGKAQYQIDDGDWQDVEDGQFVLDPGEHTDVKIRQVDKAGNVGPETNIGPIVVDKVPPDALGGALAEDTGSSASDGVTKNGTVLVDEPEEGGKAQYQIGDGDWEDVEGGQFVLDPGEYAEVNIRQVDAAGNPGPETNIGPIKVDNTPPDGLTADLVNDEGASDDDGITNDGTIQIGGIEPGSTVQYSTDGGANWKNAELDVDGAFVLPDGDYDDVSVREVDLAGNEGEPVSLGAIKVDREEPDALSGRLEQDTGSDPTDGVTKNGTVLVDEPEEGGKVQYQIGNGVWKDIENGRFDLLDDDQFELLNGEFEVVNIRQVDAAGNEGSATNIGPITVDNVAPTGLTAVLLGAAQASSNDGLTNNATVEVDGIEPNSTVQFSTDGGGIWKNAELAEDGTFALPDGDYADVLVREVDLAGNEGAPFSLGAIEIDTGLPDALGGELDEDTGSNTSDGVTNNGTVLVDEPEEGGKAQYQIDGEPWVDVAGAGFELPEGEYEVVNIRQVDAAGNEGPATDIGPIVVDKTPPAELTVALAVDDGPNTSDNISTNGKINVSGIEAGATVYVSYDEINDGEPFAVPIVAGGFVLPEGSYTNLTVYQEDLAGNPGDPTAIPFLQIVAPDALTAYDDEFALAMGEYVSEVKGPVATVDVDVIELLNTTDVTETGQKVTVSDDQSGTLFVSVSQEALVALSPGFVVELYDADGNLLYQSVTSDSPLVGGALGLTVLDVVGDDTLTATFSNLVPGDYYVLVRNDASTISELVDDLSLADIGQGGELLGAGNREFIIEALRDALEAENYLGIDALLTGVDIALIGLSGTPLTQVVDELVDILTALGVTGLADTLADAVVDAFVANAVSLLQKTTIETTLVEYSFVDETVEGNIFDNNGNGADANADTAEVVSISVFGDAESEVAIASGSSQTIKGDHGILTINSDGTFTYKSFGHPTSVGQSDVFAYSISDGPTTSVATLTFNITGDSIATDLIDAVDDTAALNMGQIIVSTGEPQTVANVDILEVGPLTFNPIEAGVLVTVGADHTGALEILVSQSNLLAVADAFRLDIYDADGRVVYSAVTDSSLLGDVAGLDILGLVGDDGLLAQVEGLPPGNYYVVVTNDSSTLNTIVQDLELAKPLGPDNQAIILNALNIALGDNALSGTVTGIVGGVLTLAQGLPLVQVLANITNALTSSPLVDPLLVDIDGVIDEISGALLSNALSIFEFTTVTTTLTEYDFTQESVSGNVLTGAGADDVGSGAVVRSVTNSDGQTQKVVSSQATEVVGKYGVLTITADGEWSYAAFGNPLSIGQTEEFEYSIGLLGASDTAKLSIAITGEPIVISNDANVAEVEWENIFNPNYITPSDTNVAVLLGVRPGSTGNFTVGNGVDISGSISVTGNLSLLPSGYIQLQKQNGGSWDDVDGYRAGFSSVLDLGNVIAKLDLTTGPELTPGNYRVAYSVGGVLTTITISTDIDATLLNQFQLAEPPVAIEGELFVNDTLGSFFSSLEVKNDSVATFTDIDVPSKVISGEFGDLTISADGSYSYLVRSDIPYSAVSRQEIFDYKVTHPSGVSADGQLEITIEPSGAGVSGFSAFMDMGGDGSDMMSLAFLLDEYLGPQEPQTPNNDAGSADYQPPLDPTLPDPTQDDPSYYNVI